MKAIVRKCSTLSIPSLPSCFKHSTGSTAVQCSMGYQFDSPDCFSKVYTADSAFLKRSTMRMFKKAVYKNPKTLMFIVSFSGKTSMEVVKVCWPAALYRNIFCSYDMYIWIGHLLILGLFISLELVSKPKKMKAHLSLLLHDTSFLFRIVHF